MSLDPAADLVAKIGLTGQAQKVVTLLSGAMAAMSPDDAHAFYVKTMAEFERSLCELNIPDASPETSEYVRRAFLAYIESRVLGALLPTEGQA